LAGSRVMPASTEAVSTAAAGVGGECARGSPTVFNLMVMSAITEKKDFCSYLRHRILHYSRCQGGRWGSCEFQLPKASAALQMLGCQESMGPEQMNPPPMPLKSAGLVADFRDLDGHGAPARHVSGGLGHIHLFLCPTLFHLSWATIL
jgi:hypothetical protein